MTCHWMSHRGELLTLIGPRGCGKSTLLNIAAGLTKATSGSVTCDGRVVNGVNSGVGYLTQRSNLLPWRTVEKNVALPLELNGTPRVKRAGLIREVLELVGLENFANHYPSQLSGGMQRRLALATMLVYISLFSGFRSLLHEKIWLLVCLGN